MDNIQASRNQLISEIYECIKMIYKLVNLPEDTRASVSNSLIPYLSMICDGIDSLFHTEGNAVLSSNYENINSINFARLIKEIRASSKLLTDKKSIKASMKILDSTTQIFHDELIADYTELQSAYVDEFGQDDLGVFYYKNAPYANSSQINLYIKPFHSSVWDVGKHLAQYSKQVGMYINHFNSELMGDIIPHLKQEDYTISLNREDFIYRDFVYSGEKNRNIFNNNIDKSVSLYLFNMQCQINFALNLLNLLIDEHPLKYRIQLLIYYYSVQAIYYANQSGYLKDLEEYQDRINIVIDIHKKIFSSTFRNNLFHYTFSQDINFSTSTNYFETMVESLTTISLKNLMDTVYRQLEIVEKLIKEIIN